MSDFTTDFDLDTTSVDTRPDRLESGTYDCIVKDAKVEESKKTPGNYNLHVEFATLDEANSQKGTVLNAGFPIHSYLPLQQSENDKAPDFKVALTKLFEAAFGERVRINADSITGLIGKTVKVKGKLKKDEEYGESFNINDYLAA